MEKIIKIYGQQIGILKTGEEVYKDFKYYLEKEKPYGTHGEIEYWPENIIFSFRYVSKIKNFRLNFDK